MSDPKSTGPKGSGSGSGFTRGAKMYLAFCALTTGFVIYGNYIGWFPTYGIFSGENSSHSSGRGYRGGGGYGGGYTHGK